MSLGRQELTAHNCGTPFWRDQDSHEPHYFKMPDTSLQSSLSYITLSPLQPGTRGERESMATKKPIILLVRHTGTMMLNTVQKPRIDRNKTLWQFSFYHSDI